MCYSSTDCTISVSLNIFTKKETTSGLMRCSCTKVLTRRKLNRLQLNGVEKSKTAAVYFHLYNVNVNNGRIINIQILQLFPCLKCTRQQILATLRRQRSLATILPMGAERVSACLSIIMGCRERASERELAHNATSLW